MDILDVITIGNLYDLASEELCTQFLRFLVQRQSLRIFLEPSVEVVVVDLTILCVEDMCQGFAFGDLRDHPHEYILILKQYEFFGLL